MTVKELIRMLQRCSPDKLVYLYIDEDYKIATEVAEYEDIVEILPFIPKKNATH